MGWSFGLAAASAALSLLMSFVFWKHAEMRKGQHPPGTASHTASVAPGDPPEHPEQHGASPGEDSNSLGSSLSLAAEDHDISKISSSLPGAAEWQNLPPPAYQCGARDYAEGFQRREGGEGGELEGRERGTVDSQVPVNRPNYHFTGRDYEDDFQSEVGRELEGRERGTVDSQGPVNRPNYHFTGRDCEQDFQPEVGGELEGRERSTDDAQFPVLYLSCQPREGGGRELEGRERTVDAQFPVSYLPCVDVCPPPPPPPPPGPAVSGRVPTSPPPSYDEAVRGSYAYPSTPHPLYGVVPEDVSSSDEFATERF